MAHSGATDRQVVLRVLGPVGVAGEEAVPIPSSRARALLAMLVLADGDAVPARALVAGLWGSRKPEHPTAALQVVVSRLRTSLGDFDIGVEHTDAGYVLVGSPGSDLARAREAAAEAEAAFAAGSIAESAVAAECGLALWAGSSLADVAGFPFHPEARRRLDSLRVDLVEQRNRVFLRTGRFAEILADIDSWTAIDPWRERLRMQHMIAAYAQQRPVEALSVYDGFRTALVEAFGIEPGHDLRELNRAILRDDPAVLVALESFRRLATERAEVTAEVAGLADTATRLVWLAQHLVGIDGVTVVPGADGERTWLLVAAAGPEAVALRLAVGGEVEPAPDVAAVLAELGDSARVDRPGA